MKLTVAVTTFNRHESLLDAVSSVSLQDNVEHEVIIVDDASDEAVSANDFSSIQCNLRIAVHSRNMGLASARNTALDLATGEYFSFCDDDDKWPPSIASSLVCAMDSAPPDVGMAIILNERCKLTCGHLFETYPRLTTLMKAGLTPPVGSQIYRTELLRDIGGYRHTVSSGVDHDLWISLARIDPRVTVAWGTPAIVGNSPSRHRITTIEHSRRDGIKKSLAIWRDDLCDVFGNDFYHHFVDSYRWYLDYSFFIKSIQRRQYFDTLLRMVYSPWLLIEIFKRKTSRMLGWSSCFQFPCFKSSRKNRLISRAFPF